MERRVRVAFVDDDQAILTNLRRSMLSMLDVWEMGFFASGADLLKGMAIDRFDVVASDMQMPKMDGASLLDIISRDYPETIRVILSGPTDSDSVFRTIGPAHIYLPKPCVPAILQQAIQSRLATRTLLDSNAMRRLLGRLSTLPCAPQLFLQLVDELRSRRASAATVAAIIGSDVAMTAELLKLTNSSYFTVKAKIATPLQAVRILGLDIVQTLVLQLGVFRQFQGSGKMAEQITALNDYSQLLGNFAEQISAAAGDATSMSKAAHCAALLSSIGSLILLHEKETEYQSVLAAVGPDHRLADAEIAEFGAESGLIGAYLLSLWGFADLVVEAVTYSSMPSRCPGQNNPLLTSLHVARALGPHFPLLPVKGSVPVVLDHDYLVATGQAHHLDRWQELAVGFLASRSSS